MIVSWAARSKAPADIFGYIEWLHNPRKRCPLEMMKQERLALTRLFVNAGKTYLCTDFREKL